MRSHWINVNGTEEVKDDEGEPVWADMQEFVGGHLELVSVLYKGERCHMLVHDEGAIMGFPVNMTATGIYREATRERKGVAWVGPPYIHGPAVVCEGMLT